MFKKVKHEDSWGPVLKKFGFSQGINLSNLEFDVSVITSGFPTELSLKNSHSSVCIYDGAFDVVKLGSSHIEYSNNGQKDTIFVRISLSREQFNYLYMISLSSKKLIIEFLTPLLNFEKRKLVPISKPIILKNCTFMIKSSSPNS